MTTALSDARIADIGLQAARQFAGTRIEDIEFTLGQGSTDDIVYRLTFLFDRDPAKENIAPLQTRIAQSIRDRLIAEGDEHYPIVRFLTRDEWARR